MQYGGEMIGKGSYGCIFHPYIPCKGERYTGKQHTNRLSKIFVMNVGHTFADKEFKMNQNVKNLPKSASWAELWNKKCIPIDYDELFEFDKDIFQCIQSRNITKDEFNKNRVMLLGNYGGITMLDYMKSLIQPDTFTKPKLFQQKLLQIIRKMRQLFIGLEALTKYKISHLDINPTNILVKNNQMKFIDFGESGMFRDKDIFQERSYKVFMEDRVYIPYPIDFIYLYGDKQIIRDEIKDLKRNIYRLFWDEYATIHKLFFGRTFMDEHYKDVLHGNIHVNVASINETIDIYSLGMLLPYGIILLLLEYNIPMNILQNLLYHEYIHKELLDYIYLFTDMTELDSTKRITSKEALQRFQSIGTLSKKSSTTKKPMKHSIKLKKSPKKKNLSKNKSTYKYK